MAVAPKKTAPKTGSAVANYDEELAKYAQASAKSVAHVAQGSFVGTRGGILSFNGSPVPGNELDVIIIDFVNENDFFSGKFDPDTPQPPICYAFSRDPDNEEDPMRPHEKASEPQSEACKGCEQNEWGSADTGRGKACKNTYRLAVILASSLEGGAEGIKDAEVAYIKPPVTSGKGFAGFVKSLKGMSLPPFMVVTTVSLVPDASTQFKMLFQVADGQDVGREHIPALIAKRKVVEEQIVFPYPEPGEAPAPKRGGPSKVGGRTTAKPAAKPAPRGRR